MRIIVHYLLAVAILTVYGSQVDQMMAALPPINLGSILLIAYAAAYGFRGLLEKRIVILGDDLSQPRCQFLFDFSLNIFAGLLAAILNIAIHGYSILSQLSLVYGMITYGFFIALDMAWLTRVETGPVSIGKAILDITYEILFIIGALLGHGINLIYSYSRNLTLLFKNETRVLERVSRGDLDSLVPVITQDEFGLSAVHINSMIEGLRHRIQLLTALKLAEEVQRNLLPTAPLRMPGIDLSGTSIYCEETGGDYWDYFLLPGGRLGLVVADASGHGVDAALFMSTARAFLIIAVRLG